MAEVAKSIYLNIDGTDLSSYAKSVRFDTGSKLVDISALDGSGVEKSAQGLKTYNLEVEFYQDYDTVDATLFPLIGASAFTITYRPSSDPVSASNPEYSGDFVLESYSPIDSTAGDVIIARATFRPAGDISRSTS